MTRFPTAAVTAFLFFCGPSAFPAGPIEPVNPNASPEARALLRYLYSISGQYTLSGQHNFPNTIARWTDRAYDLTGKFPAVFGQDFGFQGGEDKDSILARPALVAEIQRQYRHGAVITLTWHAVRPTDDEPVWFRDSVQGHLTDFEWSELLRPSPPPAMWTPRPCGPSTTTRAWRAGRKGDRRGQTHFSPREKCVCPTAFPTLAK